MFGKTHSEEVRQKIRLARLGKKLTPEQRAAQKGKGAGRAKTESFKKYMKQALCQHIAQIDPVSGNVIRVWLRAETIAAELGLTLCTIRECCMGYYWNSRKNERTPRTPLYAGYNWQYTNEPVTALSIEIGKPEGFKRIKPIVQLHILTNEVIRLWPSVSEAANTLCINIEGIRSCCKGYYSSKSKTREMRQYAGYAWQYIGEKNVLHQNHPTMLSTPYTRVLQVDFETDEILNIWKSCAEAGRTLGFDANEIQKVCRGKRKHHKGYGWQFMPWKRLGL